MKKPTMKRNLNFKLQSVIIVVNTFERGGAEMSLAILANELAIKGVQVTFISLWEGKINYNFNSISKNGVKLINLNKAKNFLLIAFKLFVICRVFKV